MANDDYFVVVFKLLSYYYAVMKKGEEVDFSKIDSLALMVNESYLMNIYRNMFDEGYLTGSKVVTDYSGNTVIDDISNVRVTTKGIEYLQENEKMKKVANVLRGLKVWLPFLQALS